VKVGDSCTAGQLTLSSDGTVGGADGATWDGDAARFEVCVGGSCLTCTSTGKPSPSAPKCSGKALSCGTHDPIGCESHTGCYWDSEINYYDYTYTPICGGFALSCSSRDEVDCAADDGCTWE
jgi:hypothetical protein